MAKFDANFLAIIFFKNGCKAAVDEKVVVKSFEAMFGYFKTLPGRVVIKEVLRFFDKIAIKMPPSLSLLLIVEGLLNSLQKEECFKSEKLLSISVMTTLIARMSHLSGENFNKAQIFVTDEVLKELIKEIKRPSYSRDHIGCKLDFLN